MTCAITLADAIAALVAQKRVVGYKYDTEARVLARFEAFCRIEFPGLSPGRVDGGAPLTAGLRGTSLNCAEWAIVQYATAKIGAISEANPTPQVLTIGRAAAGPLRIRRPPHQPAAVRFDGDAGVPRRPAARARRRGAHRPGLADRPHRRVRGSPGHARLGRDRGGSPRTRARPDPPGPGRIGCRIAFCLPRRRLAAGNLDRGRRRRTAAARRALHNALALAEPLDALRPFVQAGPGVRELLVHHHGSVGASHDFAHRALAAGPARETRQALLSERELTVLNLLPSMLSLDEIAADLTVSVNTVKSHVRSIYAKLGVSSRRLAVLAAHEHGLLNSARRPRGR